MAHLCLLALGFHLRSIRSANEFEINEIITNSGLADKYNSSVLKLIWKELYEPCNILEFDYITRKYSFGHFRFQEHLVALELENNRTIEFSSILSDWWFGALGLFAQNNDFSFIFEELFHKYGSINKGERAIRTMLNNCSQRSKNNILPLFNSYLESDRLDPVWENKTFDESFGADDWSKIGL